MLIYITSILASMGLTPPWILERRIPQKKTAQRAEWWKPRIREKPGSEAKNGFPKLVAGARFELATFGL
jgi:hypothetical protein